MIEQLRLKPQCLWSPNLGGDRSCLLSVTQNNTGTVWEHHKGYEYYEVRIIGGTPGAGYYSCYNNYYLVVVAPTMSLYQNFHTVQSWLCLLSSTLYLSLVILGVHSSAFPPILEPLNVLSINIFSDHGNVVGRILRWHPKFLCLVYITCTIPSSHLWGEIVNIVNCTPVVRLCYMEKYEGIVRM